MLHGMEPQFDSNGNETGDIISFPPEGRTLEIEIPDGSPSFGALISFIQQIIDSQRNSFSFLQMNIDNINGFVTFRFKTLAECISWNASYYDPQSGQATFSPDNKPATKAFYMPSVNLTSQPDYINLKRIYMGTKLADERGIQSDLLRDAEKNANDYPIQYNINFNPANTNKIRTIGWILDILKIILTVMKNKKEKNILLMMIKYKEDLLLLMDIFQQMFLMVMLNLIIHTFMLMNIQEVIMIHFSLV